MTALPRDQGALVAAVGLVERRREGLPDPEPHGRRGDLAPDHHQPRPHARDDLGQLGSREPVEHARQPDEDVGARLAELHRHPRGLLEAVHQLPVVEAERPERAADQLVLAAVGPPTHAHRNDAVAVPHAERAEGPEPEQVLELVLQPGAMDGERLARGAAGAHREERRRVVPPRQQGGAAFRPHRRLVGGRDQIEIHDAPDVTGMEPVAIEQAPVERHRLVGVAHQAAEPGVLPRAELGAARAGVPPGGPQRRAQLGMGRGHPTAFSVGAVAPRAGDAASPRSSRARTGLARGRPKLSVMSATRSISPWLVASSVRSKPW